MTTILASQSVFSSQQINIVPKPLTLEVNQGTFSLDKKVCVVNSDASHTPVAEYLIDQLTDQAELTLRRKNKPPFFARTIVLTSKGADAALGDEGYTLTVDKKKITICASKPAGLFYGVQSLLQLIPEGSAKYPVPCVQISDKPRFGWRGMHQDVSRHFFTVQELKDFIDVLAVYKFNIFHLHLTDDQGWRLEIKSYPLLTEKGAWRTENNQDEICNERAKTDPTFVIPQKHYRMMDGQRVYGGFYTQEQIKDIIAYAAARQITIIPEIDVPGHFKAAIDQYPYLSCRGEGGWGSVFSDPLCPGNEKVFEFVEQVIDEVAALFPAEYIHIGGDEVEKSQWKQCPKCQGRIKSEGLKDEFELQSYFIKRVEKMINARGKKMIGWDEIHEGGLSASATVMQWRSWAMDVAVNAAKEGNNVIMCPTSHCYFDYSYDGTGTKHVYGFEPVPEGLSDSAAKHILGTQANLWSERIPSAQRRDYMAMPRMLALAEVAWSPKDQRDWESFSQRLEQQYPRLDRMNIHYRIPDPEGLQIGCVFLENVKVEISKPLESMKVYYTLDGTEPTTANRLYAGPITISETTTIKAKGYLPGGHSSTLCIGTYEKQALRKPVDVAGTKSGLNCEYRIGGIKSVDLISTLPVKKVSVEKQFGIPGYAKAPAFALVYSGYIRVPADGVYTFYASSDDGSRLLIGSKVVVENDGPHAPRERSGQIALQAGVHPIKVLFFEGGGGEVLSVDYESPGIQKMTIPANVLFTETQAVKSEPTTQTLSKETEEQFNQRMAWWRDGRFGMFIHWGLYAIPAGEWEGEKRYAEWIRHKAQIPHEEYMKFAPQFNPVDFNAAEWVRMAKEAGMKYIVITSKHHDGFCLYGSDVTDYDVMDATPFKRDILKELADECKKQGIRMCFYYSIMDWHHPDYLPRRKWENRPSEGADYQKYVSYMKAQLKELVQRYDPGVLWFDGEWEKTWTHEEGLKLYDYVRSLNADIIVNNRVDKGRRGMEGMSKGNKFAGDFGTPEQQIPATGIPGYDWESCMTMNKHWGWNKHDKKFKSTKDLIRKLVDIASKGGNFLLNIGPKPDGTFPQESIDRLKAIGQWIDVNGKSIYGTTASIFAELPWGRSTTKGNTLYLHVFDWPEDGKLRVPGLVTPAEEVFLLADPTKKLTIECSNDGALIQLPAEPVDKIATVIELKFSEAPKVISK